MRLIDKDTLHQTFMKWFKKEMLNDEKISKTISWADALLREEPEVEAIPIEWLKNYERLLTEAGIRLIEDVIGEWMSNENNPHCEEQTG